MKLQQDNHDFLLPVGTRIITVEEVKCRSSHAIKPKGSYAEIVFSPNEPTQLYSVRFNDGAEAKIRRSSFELYVQSKNGDLDRDVGISDNVTRYEQYNVYKCIIGSKAYGLANEDSDDDIRGVYLPPASWHWSIYGVPDQIECKVPDLVYWEYGKFVRLALKSNPNILECLYSPLVLNKRPPFSSLLFNRSNFLSKIAYKTYSGYAASQFHKLKQDLEARGDIRWKHAMHLIRLLISGIHLFNHHEVLVDVGEHRDGLLAIRNKELSFDQVDSWRLRLQDEFEKAMIKTTLPDQPNYEKANELLIGARKAALEGGWLY